MSDIAKLQNLIDNSDNIVFFGGAGVSTESGVRDFRGKNGLYKDEKTSHIVPEYMLSNRCLIKEPEAFFKYYKENMNCLNAKPNIAHYYLKRLEDKGKLKAIVTQNIDGLHQKAGSKNVFEIHGTMNDCYCMKCGKRYQGDYIFKSNGIPKCDCGGVVRPDVVLYGEMLPEAYSYASYYILNADVLIVAGTSLTVEPASGLLKVFGGKHLVIINDQKTPYDYMAELIIHKPLGEVFSKLK
jgi:NAD-dependent deacetylase